MKFKRVGILIAVVLAVIIYLFNRADVELTKQDTFSVASIGGTGFLLKSELHLNNPNLLSSTIKTITEKYFIAGREVARMNMEINQGIPGRKETSFPISVRFSKADIQAIFPDDTLLTDVKAEVTVTGEITFQNVVGGGTIKVNQKDSVLISII